MPLNESTVEDAALNWFSELGYSLLHGQAIAPGEAAAERSNFSEAFLPERLRAALKKLNPKIPAAALDDAFRKITIAQHPALIVNNRAFHKMLVDGIAVECRRKDGSIGGGSVITQSSELAKEVAAIYQRQGLTCEVIETDKPDTEPKESK